MNNALPILLIKQHDLNGNLPHLSFSSRDTISYKTTVFSSLSNVFFCKFYCFGKIDLLSSQKFSSFLIFPPQFFWMRQNLILISYFLSLAILILLLGPGYFLSVVQLMQLIKELNDHIWMPHPAHQNPVVWNTLGDERFDEIPHFNCPWTITTSNESITVNIIYLKWTFNYDFWIRVEIHPQGNPKAFQLLDVDELHPLFKSLATALLNYYEFPEPHFKDFQLHVYGELMDHLSYKVDWNKIMANTYLAYPDLALDKFSGTDPDQNAESFVQLIERKINSALGDAPADPDDLVSYTFRKKALFSSLLRGPAAEWYETNIENATTWADTREQFITRFSDGRNKFWHRMEVEHCERGDGEEIRNFLHWIKKIVDKG